MSRPNTSGMYHGVRGSDRYYLVRVYQSMLARCTKPAHKSYPRYGGRGITICSEWITDYESFIRWAMSAGYSRGLSLDRANNDLGYSPDNCRWVGWKQQQSNRSDNVLVTAFGETHPVRHWEQDPRARVGRNAIQKRMAGGWAAEDAITIPPYSRHTSRRGVDGKFDTRPMTVPTPVGA